MTVVKLFEGTLLKSGTDDLWTVIIIRLLTYSAALSVNVAKCGTENYYGRLAVSFRKCDSSSLQL